MTEANKRVSLHAAFKTDDNAETKGRALEIASVRVTLARAGGNNTKFNVAMLKVAKDHKRAIDLDLLSNDKSKRILYEVYAEHIVLDWETNTGTDTDPVWVDGIEMPDGSIVPTTFDAIVKTFTALPDFFIECKNFAENAQWYRANLVEDAVKNS